MNIIEIYSETNIYMYIYLIIFLIKKKHDEMTKNKSYIIKKKHHNKIFFSCLETIDKTMFYEKTTSFHIHNILFCTIIIVKRMISINGEFPCHVSCTKEYNRAPTSNSQLYIAIMAKCRVT